MAATIIIEQKPEFKTLTAGQEIIFTVSEANIVANEKRVKFIAEVYVSNENAILVSASTLVATLKTTPNGAGVGIFDISSIIESYVSPDDLATGQLSGIDTGSVSTFKSIDFSDDKQFPVHIVDKFSLGNNSVRYFQVNFKIEYLSGNSVIVDDDETRGEEYFIFNGYVKNEDILQSSSANIPALNLQAVYDKEGNFKDYIQRASTSRFLSTAPLTQYARLTDYGTVAMFNRIDASNYSFETAPSGTDNEISFLEIKLYNSANAQLGSTITVSNNGANGGTNSGFDEVAKQHFIFCGVFPGNLNNYSSVWSTHKANVSYYTVQGKDSASNEVTDLYTISIICESEKGYEGLRLTWLNRWGAWDYYTFNKKSIRSITTNKTQYTQLKGTWNDAKYLPMGYQGGRKNFRVNAQERIALNTDFLTDSESEWMQDLMNSPCVYLLNKYSFDQYEALATTSGIVNKYVEPVILTTSNFTRKTVANDKLIQYTIEVERNKTQKTQAI